MARAKVAPKPTEVTLPGRGENRYRNQARDTLLVDSPREGEFYWWLIDRCGVPSCAGGSTTTK